MTKWTKKVGQRIFSFIFVIFIIFIAWYAFLYLVSSPPIETTPALIMVWASVLILLLAGFPNVLNRIQKIKLKDFEIELQKTVKKASLQEFVSVTELDEAIFTTKGNFENLYDILSLVLRLPNKPVLLLVNLKDDHYISIYMLSIYLYFLDLLGSPIYVLFISSDKKIKDITDIYKDEIIGAVLGKIVLQMFFKQIPEQFYRIFHNMYRSNINVAFKEILEGKNKKHELIDYLQRLYYTFSENDRLSSQHLSKRNVKEWFGSHLSNLTIKSSVTESDMKVIRKALLEENEFIMICDNEKLVSLTSLCFLTKDFTKKLINET